jgi:hypothetical protein
MRRTLALILAATALGTAGLAADRKSWNKIRYVGGTIPVKTSPYDWNTTLTITMQPPSIVLSIAPGTLFSPKQTVRIASSSVTSLSAGPGAWRRVAGIGGALLPAKPPPLFGLLQDNGFLGITWQTDDGKSAGVVLESRLVWQILPALKSVTGKGVEDSP